MNRPNPLIPQGSFLEQKAKKKPYVRVAVIIVAVHVVFIGGLLMQGCRRESPKTASTTNMLQSLPPVDTNYYSSLESNPPTPTASPETPVVGPENPTNVAVSNPPLPATTPPEPTPTPAPTPTPPVTTTPAPQAVTETAQPPVIPTVTPYTIQKGDSFYKIAKKVGVSVKAIERANPTVNPRRLHVGQKIEIPSGGQTEQGAGTAAGAEPGNGVVYVVKPGDTLSRLARRYRTTVRAIQSANGLRTTRINVGQKLRIPNPPAKTGGTSSGGSPASP